MLTECFNPACNRELLYLKDGRVVRLVKTHGEHSRVEHFWLCGECYRLHDFRFSSKEGVSLMVRSQGPADDVSRRGEVLASAEICQEEDRAAWLPRVGFDPFLKANKG